jgi:hypothetical protein
MFEPPLWMGQKGPLEQEGEFGWFRRFLGLFGQELVLILLIERKRAIFLLDKATFFAIAGGYGEKSQRRSVRKLTFAADQGESIQVLQQRLDFSSAEAFLVTFWATKSYKSVGSTATIFYFKSEFNFIHKKLILNNLIVRAFFVLPQKRYPKKFKAAQKFYDSAT